MVVKNKKTGVYHLADYLGEGTFCGLDARKMEEIKPPRPSPFGKDEENEKWEERACTCRRCRRSYEKFWSA